MRSSFCSGMARVSIGLCKGPTGGFQGSVSAPPFQIEEGWMRSSQTLGGSITSSPELAVLLFGSSRGLSGCGVVLGAEHAGSCFRIVCSQHYARLSWQEYTASGAEALFCLLCCVST